MAQVKRRRSTAQESAATKSRNFRTFLLMSQFEGKAIGARIALARNEAGLTQDDLAGSASFSRRSLQDYEAGVTVPYRHLREISALLNRLPEWFLHGDPTISMEREAQVQMLDRLEALEGQVAEGFDRLGGAIAQLEERLPPQEKSEGGS